MDHHTDAVLFEPKERFGQRSFQARTFYRLWFVENRLVQPYQEERHENAADDDSRWYCVTGKFECNGSIVTVKSSLNVGENSDFDQYEP